MILKKVTNILEKWAPPIYQESYDNSGLIYGDLNADISKALISLDCTEEVVDEAIASKCNLIISHHPILFSSLKTLTGRDYVERAIIKAIQSNIAIYAIHTNLDNIATGVNSKIAEKIGLTNTQILLPKNESLLKLVTFIPKGHLEIVSKALFEIGAGHIGNYSHCGFSVNGIGTFMGNNSTSPFIGNKNKLEKAKEVRFETVFPIHLKSQILQTLFSTHPYEEVAFDIFQIENSNQNIGSGMVGEFKIEMDLEAFLDSLKTTFNIPAIKHTEYPKKIKKVAVCGGSGSFLRNVIPSNVDAFVTSDIKYHEWFDADNKFSLIDIGHYESEQFTSELIIGYLKKNAVSLQTQKSKVNTNPVRYFT